MDSPSNSNRQSDVTAAAKKIEAAGHSSHHGVEAAYKALSDDYATHAQHLARHPEQLHNYLGSLTSKLQSDDPKLAAGLPRVWLAQHTGASVDAAHKVKPDGSTFPQILDPKNKQWNELDRQMVKSLMDQSHAPLGDRQKQVPGKDDPAQPQPGSDQKQLAKRAVDQLSQQLKLGADGTYLYDLATKSLEQRAKLTGEGTTGDDTMREVNRIMVNNGYQDAHLDGKSHITMKDLPKGWNNVKNNQEFKLYTDQERQQLAETVAKRMAQSNDAPHPDDPNAKGGPDGGRFARYGAPEAQRPVAPPQAPVTEVRPPAPLVTPEVRPMQPSTPLAPRTDLPQRSSERPLDPRVETQPVEKPTVRFPTEKAAEIPKILDNMSISPQHTQMAVVVADSTRSTRGTMQLYERINGHWQATNQMWPVNVGAGGMAWGDGLVENSRSLGGQKHEGDHKAPAGIFSLGTAFGRGDDVQTRMPYRPIRNNDYFVDDPNSPAYYNRWQTLPPNTRAPWGHAEHMTMYSLGVVVNHNMNPVVPGHGSAIFLHTWSRPGVGTEGCTSMSDANMRSLLRWLDPGKQPLLLQVPNESIDTLRSARIRSGM
jgi:L,D-peptidoglycan transpeptidase YkuD (ErfK/YbiS/YcfS/YnhG family)